MDILRLVVLINNYESNLYREIKIKSIFKPKNREELKNAVDICYNNINNDNNKLKYMELYGDISLWDVSEVTNMRNILSYKLMDFNCNIFDWDVSNVVVMSYIFHYDISLWDTSSVTKIYLKLR